MLTDETLIASMAKQLPPSAADLQLLDIGGVCADVLRQLRPDIVAQTVSLNPDHWQMVDNHFDAVTAYDCLLEPPLLAAILRALRPGGRFIVVQPAGAVDQTHVEALENADYVRILVEAAVEGQGVLIRGEKAHTTDDTRARVDIAAGRDDDHLTLDTLRGRYVHLLIQQQPNKPVWKLTPDDHITWTAAAVARDQQTLLAFSSLPKAVQFLQDAVMQGVIRDINKVAKFNKAVIADLETPVLINPTLDWLTDDTLIALTIDPTIAEAPDE